MGVALAAADVRLMAYRGVFCWHRHGQAHPLRANELGQWLTTSSPVFVEEVEIAKRTGERRISPQEFAGRRGIVLCVNFWRPGNQGDHIDLWNGSVMAGGRLDFFGRSEEVHFWRVR